MNEPTDNWLTHRAYELARKAAAAANEEAQRIDSLPEDMKYLQTASLPDWQPHTWVIQAIVAAMKERDREHELMQAAMTEKHESHCTHLVATTAMAILESVDVPSVTINLEKQRTITDRYNIHYQHIEAEDKVVMTLLQR